MVVEQAGSLRRARDVGRRKAVSPCLRVKPFILRQGDTAFRHWRLRASCDSHAAGRVAHESSHGWGSWWRFVLDKAWLVPNRCAQKSGAPGRHCRAGKRRRQGCRRAAYRDVFTAVPGAAVTSRRVRKRENEQAVIRGSTTGRLGSRVVRTELLPLSNSSQAGIPAPWRPARTSLCGRENEQAVL